MAAWGEAFGKGLTRPAAVGISGELGAGKTTLVQAICRGLGVTEHVTSPTYSLVHQYSSPAGPVYHIDAYRLKPQDTDDLGMDDMQADARAVLLIEWIERLANRAPRTAHRILLDYADDGVRRRLRAS